jgi:hypothetical protein
MKADQTEYLKIVNRSENKIFSAYLDWLHVYYKLDKANLETMKNAVKSARKRFQELERMIESL